jgi:hypothetical protein
MLRLRRETIRHFNTDRRATPCPTDSLTTETRRAAALLIALGMMGACSVEPGPSQALAADVKGAPGALTAFVGDWTCAAQYRDVPPFSFAHPATADFTVTVDGNSILGDYRETQALAPLIISDQLTAKTPTTGARLFHDSNGGQETGTYTMLVGIGGGLHLDFVGDYQIAGFSFPFTEQLDLASDSNSFQLEASIVGQVFQTATCTRVLAVRRTALSAVEPTGIQRATSRRITAPRSRTGQRSAGRDRSR